MLLFRLSLLLIIKPKCNKFEHIPTDITFPINFSSDTGEYFSRENTKFGPLNKYVCMYVCRLLFISYYFAWYGSLDILRITGEYLNVLFYSQYCCSYNMYMYIVRQSLILYVYCIININIGE